MHHRELRRRGLDGISGMKVLFGRNADSLKTLTKSIKIIIFEYEYTYKIGVPVIVRVQYIQLYNNNLREYNVCYYIIIHV